MGAGAGTHRLPPVRRGDTHGQSRTPRTGMPRMIGPYRLVGSLGEGGMGVVYKGLDPRGKVVAVKVLRDHIAHDTAARDRLRREVSTLVRVKSPNVASFLDADVDAERPYLVTSFVPGASLDSVVEDDGPFGAARLAKLGRGLADALGAIHAAGIVHRDLKPGNVLLVGEDPVLIDFGIAHVADDARLTSTGLVMGTPGYLSPEIVEGAEVGEATDWWGWAATLAFAASGRAPFGRGPMAAVLDRVTRGRADLSGVDPRLQPLLEAALSPDPSQRPSAREVLAELEVFAGGGQTGHIPLRSSKPATQVIQTAPGSAAQAARTEYIPPQPAHRQRVVRPAERPVQPAAPQTRPTPGPRIADRGAPGPRSADPRQADPALPPGRFVPPPDPRIGRPARTGTLAALAAAVTGVSAVWPTLAIVAVLIWAVAARWCDKTVTSMVLRRFTAGRRKYDGVVAALSSPWHGVVAVLATLLTVLIPAFVGACAAAAVALGSAMANGGQAYVGRPLPVAVGTLVAILVMWWGPGGVSLRRGSRSIVRAAVRGQQMTWIVCGVLVAIAVLCGLWALSNLGTTIDTWPISSDLAMPLDGIVTN